MAGEALLDSLETISRTARAIADDTPGLEDKFYLPDPKTDQALLTAGRVFANDAQQFRSTFVAHAIPKAFGKRLEPDPRTLNGVAGPINSGRKNGHR